MICQYCHNTFDINDKIIFQDGFCCPSCKKYTYYSHFIKKLGEKVKDLSEEAVVLEDEIKHILGMQRLLDEEYSDVKYYIEKVKEELSIPIYRRDF